MKLDEEKPTLHGGVDQRRIDVSAGSFHCTFIQVIIAAQSGSSSSDFDAGDALVECKMQVEETVHIGNRRSGLRKYRAAQEANSRSIDKGSRASTAKRSNCSLVDTFEVVDVFVLSEKKRNYGQRMKRSVAGISRCLEPVKMKQWIGRANE